MAEFVFPGVNPGQRVGADGKYTIVKKIGEGVFGVVYKATSPNPGGRNLSHAIKFVSKNSSGVKETALLNAMSNPYIVPATNSFTFTDNHIGIVMPLFSNGSVDDIRLHDFPGFMPYQYGVFIAYQLASALNFLKENNIIHRDIKPANILVKDIGPHGYIHVQLADFGIAAVTNNGLAVTIAGTPITMAPEHWINMATSALFGISSQYDHKVDIWSMGASLYCILTGSHIEMDVIKSMIGNQTDFVWPEIEPGTWTRWWYGEKKKYRVHSGAGVEISDDILTTVLGCLKIDPNHRISADDICLKFHEKANQERTDYYKSLRSLGLI